MLPDEVRDTATAYLRLADRLLPGWITGFYVVGSAALGEYVPRRSDVDFIATVASDPPALEIPRVKSLHVLGAARASVQSKRRGAAFGAGTPNGAFVRDSDVRLPVTAITPVASHVGHSFRRGAGFDVNPVMWKVLSEKGLAVRGTDPSNLGLDCQPDVLTQWNLDNLNSYWRRWAETVRRGRLRSSFSGLRYGAAWAVGWGALGPPRLHYTITTGDVIGKRTAGEYALDTFDNEWHDIIRLGLGWWHRDLPDGVTPDDVRRTGEFVLAVIESAEAVAATPG